MFRKVLLLLRKIVALMVLLLAISAFTEGYYPIKVFDIQLTAVAQRFLTDFSVTAGCLLGFVILITLLFGRIYCSTLCPLGIYQELLTIIFKPFYRKRKIKYTPHDAWSYILALIAFTMLFAGTAVVIRLFDPYSVFGNALSLAWYGIIFITALTILVFFKSRFFCTNICPVGAILGFISRFSLLKLHINTDKCKMCGLCARACPCGAIDAKNHTVNNETCVKCFKCLPHCHHGALYYGLRQSQKIQFNLKRRQFIKTGLLLTAIGAAYKGGIEFSKIIGAKIKKVILPAGAGKLPDFANRCLNCNLCVKNCPMNIIKKATDEVPFVHIEYEKSYCKYDCHKCSEICPSGAIKRLNLAQKQQTQIAVAHVDENTCIQCGLCVGECPREVISKEFGEFPNISVNKCIGCGKCASVCPVHAISITPVDEQKLI